ncbi:hypothetical protein [Mesorhizobium onobrychidis]|uniref:Uncharacterized protein n=1 Tax=Mesorhizobium onobrychidis TaxID=2775404 RepID=A0ABY5QYN9_9HYPH|nr:hypothetical protein [Mesorhizobium onobrychidis]UVC15177.1 hypothetical protein IHQ72_32180 [Mesorhizobium onobrychidis]
MGKKIVNDNAEAGAVFTYRTGVKHLEHRRPGALDDGDAGQQILGAG